MVESRTSSSVSFSVGSSVVAVSSGGERSRRVISSDGRVRDGSDGVVVGVILDGSRGL